MYIKADFFTFSGSFKKNNSGTEAIKLIKNLQNVNVSDGRLVAIAFADTHAPPHSVMERIIRNVNSLVLFWAEFILRLYYFSANAKSLLKANSMPLSVLLFSKLLAKAFLKRSCSFSGKTARYGLSPAEAHQSRTSFILSKTSL